MRIPLSLKGVLGASVPVNAVKNALLARLLLIKLYCRIGVLSNIFSCRRAVLKKLSVYVPAVAVHSNHRWEVFHFKAVDGFGKKVGEGYALALFDGIAV